MTIRTKLNESAIETYTLEKLRNLEWVEDIHSIKQNIWRQQPATEEQRKKMNRKRADFILYKSGNDGTLLDNPLIVIECKKPGENIANALEQGIKYAEAIDAPLVIATTGEFTKCFNVKYKQILTINGEDVKDLFSEKEALKFIENPHIITKEDKVILSRQELIKVFQEVNELLWKIGLQKGDERFSEFANILFLKIIGEIEETKKNDSNSNKNKKFFWNNFCNKRGEDLKNAIDKALEYFQDKYGEQELFSDSKIESEKVLEKIVDKLNPLSLIDTKTDIKGEAFEYFLQSYNSGSKDLGEYFTPRHIIKALITILRPLFKDKVYDPFCGTGGILTESFKYVSNSIKDNEENREELKKCFFGNEISRTARIAKMNMILFGDGHNSIIKRNTFGNPVENEYDLVITNIPFGQDDGENEYGHLYEINCKYGDCLAIQHCIRACKENGRVALIMPEGFFTQRIKKYQDTKKWIIKNYSIQAIISLPKGTFLPYTGAKSSVIILEKRKKTKDYFYYYQIKNDGFTLNNQRRKIEGINDLDILISTWRESVIDDKVSSSLFTKIYYSDVEKNDYNLLTKDYNFSLPENKERNYLSLSKISTFERGYIGKSQDSGELRFIQIADLDDQGEIICNNKKYINIPDGVNKEKFLLKKGEIIIAIVGTCGKAGIFRSEERAVFSSNLMRLNIDKKIVLPEYLLYLFKSQNFLEKIEVIKKGTAQPYLDSVSLGKITFPIPSLEEQKKIIKHLNNIKKIIENSNINAANIDLSRSISLHLEEKFIVKRLGELANFEYGYLSKASEEGEFRFIQTGDIDKHGNFLEKKKKYVDMINEVEKDKYLLKENDIIVARHGNCGRTAFFQSEENSIFTNDLIRIKFHCEEILPKYYWFFSKTKEYWDQASELTGGTAQPQFNTNSLKEIKIPIPNLETQMKIVDEREKDSLIILYNNKSIELLKEKENKFLSNLW
ncbi:MAG: hypothetical protein AD073_000311 [Mycoplasmataceae bacterium]|nr:MAG: hypothetical protein AD073_000311 [Mycoplasmataceae bacterium]